MKSRVEFNIKGIQYISFKPVKKLNWKFFKHIPEQRTFFGMFKTQKALFNGWSVSGQPYYNGYTGWEDWRTTNSLKNQYFQEIEGNNEPWFDYSVVVIQKVNTSHTKRFKTNDEANQFIDEVKQLSGETFKIMYHD